MLALIFFAEVKNEVKDFNELLQHVVHGRAVCIFEYRLNDLVNCVVIHAFTITIAGWENTVGDVGPN
jgi:hypothetical protein